MKKTSSATSSDSRGTRYCLRLPTDVLAEAERLAESQGKSLEAVILESLAKMGGEMSATVYKFADFATTTPTSSPVGDEMAEHKPSAFYFRKALREAETLADAQEIGNQIIRELEMHKKFIAALGHEPPCQFILSTEAEGRGLFAEPMEG
jgi:hypothetical protein